MSSESKADLGVFGLGTMGQALALNGVDCGHRVVGTDISADAVQGFAAAAGERAHAAATLEAFIADLAQPRRILLMIPAGPPVEQALQALAPLLAAGDIVIDGGNSHPADTIRRGREGLGKGAHFLGMGVSGGEDGARHGPSMMAGGSENAWSHVQPILEPMAAKGALGPCVARVGPGAAGHLVKTVHNGIEYGDMQLLAEAWDLMQQVFDLSPTQAADWFEGMHSGPLRSFLTEITTNVLRLVDPDSGEPAIHKILDVAGQKGTGRWTAQLAIEHGVPAPTLLAAVQARALSAARDQRLAITKAAGRPNAPAHIAPSSELQQALSDALLAGRLTAYAQGFQLLKQLAADGAAGDQPWELQLAEVARIWTAGCIIRADVLGAFRSAFQTRPADSHPFMAPELLGTILETAPGLSRILAIANDYGVPTPALSASHAYLTSLRRERLPQDLTQAQRDAFGAHGFARIDRPTDQRHHLPQTQ